MFRTVIAALTAVSLAVTPVQAQEFDSNDFGKFLFGLVALTVLGQALGKDRDDPAPQVAHQPRPRDHWTPPVVRDRGNRLGDDRVPRRPPVFQPRVHEPPVTAPRGPRHGRDARVLPGECFFTAQTRFGPQNMFGYGCLQRHYRHAADLPGRCEVRVYAEGGPRRGYDPLCLRYEGYTSTRRH